MVNWRKPVLRALLHLGSSIPRRLGQIVHVDGLPRQELVQYQREKLARLLRHAFARVPYYRRVLGEARVVRAGRVDLERFGDVPPLTKEIIRREGAALHSADHGRRKSYENTSGGSTGEPVRLLQDRQYWAWNVANKLYYKTFGGQEIGERELRFWGSERDLLEGRERVTVRLRNWLYNRVDVNAFKMSEADMRRAVDLINRWKPTWIEGYVQSLYEFATYVESRGAALHAPRGAIATAGVLDEDVRALIERVLGCKAFNRYGSREVGDVACSCQRQQGLHLSVWNHYFEILGPDLSRVQGGQQGKVYVTSLNNFSMPLVRYEIGDIAVPAADDRCPCGRSSPLIQKVVGRTVSVFRTRSGDRVDGEFFTHLLYGKAWVKQFQVVQRDYEQIDVSVVPAAEAPAEDLAAIEQAIRKVMGAPCKVSFHFVDEISPTASGKYLYTVSEVERAS